MKNFNIETDQALPVYCEAEIEIAASAEKVYSVLSTISKWPKWQKVVTKTDINSAPVQGVVFKWKAAGLNFTSEIHTAKAPHYFGWTGKTIGAKAIHNWEIIPTEKGCKVKVMESQYGFLPRLFKQAFRKNLEKGMPVSLQELKMESEK